LAGPKAIAMPFLAYYISTKQYLMGWRNVRDELLQPEKDVKDKKKHQ